MYGGGGGEREREAQRIYFKGNDFLDEHARKHVILLLCIVTTEL